jgi:hypothetical protein
MAAFLVPEFLKEPGSSRLCSRHHIVGIFESFAEQSFQKYQQHL